MSLKQKSRKKYSPLESLKKNKQFKRVYKYGKVRAGKHTVLIFCKNKEGFTRLGITISKKVGKSVVRHRLKRLYREVFRFLKHDIKDGFDIVVVARKDSDKADFWVVLNEMRYLLTKGKLFK